MPARARRVQLRRSRGWRLPPATVSVARPTRWGNPLRSLDDPSAAAAWFTTGMELRRRGALRADHPLHSYPSDEEIRGRLAGMNLACWCPLDRRCHADVLLDIAAGASPGARPAVPAPPAPRPATDATPQHRCR